MRQKLPSPIRTPEAPRALYHLQTGQQAGVYFAGLTHQGQNGVVFPGGPMCLHSLALQPADQAVNLVLRSSGFEGDDHTQFSLVWL